MFIGSNKIQVFEKSPRLKGVYEQDFTLLFETSNFHSVSFEVRLGVFDLIDINFPFLISIEWLLVVVEGGADQTGAWRPSMY